MTEQYVPNLGHPPEPDARRDAVHIAVAPVVAAHRLRPGDHVGFFPHGEYGEKRLVGYGFPKIGVVDPFLTSEVEEGQSFWMFLFPGTVTSLRHVWTHPAFKAKLPDIMESAPS